MDHSKWRKCSTSKLIINKKRFPTDAYFAGCSVSETRISYYYTRNCEKDICVLNPIHVNPLYFSEESLAALRNQLERKKARPLWYNR